MGDATLTVLVKVGSKDVAERVVKTRMCHG
jgi:hypothetical protein